MHRGLLYDSSFQHSEPGNKANDYLAMRYRSIDHGRVSRRRQCLGNCSKCATSTSKPKNRLRYSGRRIRFHGRASRSYCDDKNDVHQPRRNTFELKRETRRAVARMYVHDEKFRTIFCKINERPCCTARCPYPDWYWIKRGGRSIMSRALRGC